MIPKIIHFCWFGNNPYPSQIKSCMQSWQEVLRDYEFCRWDEKKFDINSNTYVRQAYEHKKWAFVADYVRLWALYHYGGVYLDSDVRVLKPIDKFLNHGCFSGYENKRNIRNIPTGTIGAEKGHPFIKLLLDYYADKRFVRADGTLDMTTNVTIITGLAEKKYSFIGNGEYQVFGEDINIYPYDYFSGLGDNRVYTVIYKNDYEITDNTHTIHEFAGSWRKKLIIRKVIRRYGETLRKILFGPNKK